MRILPKESLIYEKFEKSIKVSSNLHSVKLLVKKYYLQVPDYYKLSLNHLYQLCERVANYSFT